MAGHPQADGGELVRSQLPTTEPRGIPKLRLPIDLDMTGDKVRLGTLEQGSPDDIVQNVWVVLATDEGQRDELPDFGNPDQAFTDEFDLEVVNDAIEDWEPRAVYLDDAQLDGVLESVRVEVT